MCVERERLVFNDVFHPLTDSTQLHGEESAGIKQQQESVLVVFCVRGWDCELFMGS